MTRRSRRRKWKNFLKSTLSFLFWVSVMIVVLLVFSFFTDPRPSNIFSGKVSNLKSTLENRGIDKSNTIRVVPSEMTSHNEYGPYAASMRSCSTVEALAEMNGVSNIKQKACREACGKKSLEYDSNDCEADLLVCYCK